MSAMLNPTPMDVSATGCKLPPACPFLHILNLDIRTIIYQYLLVGSYNKRELDTKSREYDRDRWHILMGLDQSYKFHLSILGTNRQIRGEAMDIFQRMNTSVSVTHYSTIRNVSWGIGLHNLKSEIVVEGVGALKNINLETHGVSIFLIEDLPAACATLQRDVDRALGKASIRISISSHIGAVSDLLVKKGYTMPDPKFSRCLTPLGRMRGFNHVEIHGLVSSKYTSAIIAAMCDRPLTVAGRMELIGAQMDQGDEASMKNHWETAIHAYKEAMHTLHGIHFVIQHGEDVVMIGGRFHEQRASRASRDAKVQLNMNISNAYFHSGRSRLARVERAYGPLRSSDDRDNRYKFPLQIDPTYGARPAVYAELLVMAARISISHGQFGEATGELGEACNLDPGNLDAQKMLDECTERCSVRRERFISHQERQRDSAQRKLDEAIHVIESRKAKGDEAFRNKDFGLARVKYEAAFDKALKTQSADYLSYSQHYDYPDLRFPSDLKLGILSDLVTLSLEVHAYDDVHRWADEILVSEPDGMYYCQLPGNDYMLSHVGKACYTAYYGKAFASLKQGNPSLAIENFINASLCNNRCEATYYLLEDLTRTGEWKESAEASRKRELYLSWDSMNMKVIQTW